MKRTIQAWRAAALCLPFVLAVAALEAAPLPPAAAPATTAARDYDIRRDTSATARQRLAQLVQQGEVDAAPRLARRLEAATQRLRARLPDLHLEPAWALPVPELVARNSTGGKFLTPPSDRPREALLREFIAANAALYGLEAAQVDDLLVAADYANPEGGLAWVHLEQRVNGIAVFAGEVKAGFTAAGEIIRTISNLAPALEPARLPTDPGDVQQAVRRAARWLGLDLPPGPLPLRAARDGGLVVVLDRGPFADDIVAEAMYFPLAPGVARLAWRVLVWQPEQAWYVIVDAEAGDILWAMCLTDQQTQSATYAVYNDISPAPTRPAPLAPDGTQGPLIPRSLITLIGNEGPHHFNNLGWINDGGQVTTGNNVDAGLDRAAPGGIDPDGRAVATPFRTFNFIYNPSPGNPAPGDEPLSPAYPPTRSAYQNGVITNAFVWANRFHDLLYRVGFTEQARNFQMDNFGRGGIGGDRVTVELQDSSGNNNANFTAGADGTGGRMQLFIWPSPTPDRDGGLDQSVALHELTHGLSRRLVGNGAGLAGSHAAGLGEGWSDFYALAVLSAYAMSPAAQFPIDGLHTIGAYSVFLVNGMTSNNYYGIKRFPYARRSLTGGPGNRSHNPLTFADIDPVQYDASDGAYPRGPVASNTPTSPHNMGEVWALALFEIRARLITRLGYEPGNLRMLQLVTDGMKLTPVNPNFIQARDGVLAAAAALGGSDSADVWSGFARRGMGHGAATDTTVVVESFRVPDSIFRNGYQPGH